MRLPVLIAARNEAHCIGKTLQSLDARSVDPIVVVNDSRDDTAVVAKHYTDNVYTIPEAGKMLAIQHGLGKLGEQALGPVLYTDADTQPRFPNHWAAAMLRGLGAQSRVGSGLLMASDGTLPQRTIFSAVRLANSLEKRLHGDIHVAGANMITRIETAAALRRVMALDNFWRNEDVARATAIAEETPLRLILKPTAIVMTSSRYKPSPVAMLRHGKRQVREMAQQDRDLRAAPGTKPYFPV